MAPGKAWPRASGVTPDLSINRFGRCPVKKMPGRIAMRTRQKDLEHDTNNPARGCAQH
jgi:hypothetical protein